MQNYEQKDRKDGRGRGRGRGREGADTCCVYDMYDMHCLVPVGSTWSCFLINPSNAPHEIYRDFWRVRRTGAIIEIRYTGTVQTMPMRYKHWYVDQVKAQTQAQQYANR